MRIGTHLPVILSLILWITPASGFADKPRSEISDWHYGGTVDVSYAIDFNFPENHQWRSKTTTTRVNELAPNVAMGYVRKDATLQSRWGLEFGLQEGNDTDGLVPPTIPGRDKPVGHANQLQHFSRANVSYLAPVGNGLNVTAGLFNSYIGYDSFYSRNNSHYTRTYMADNSPYFMFGLAATYPVHESWQVGLYIINAYNYLSHINDQPSYGAQVQWKPTSRVTVTENWYYGSDQSSTAIEFWRFFSNSIVEWKDGPWTLALAYDIGTENAAEQAGHPRTFWTAGALSARWNINGPWSVALRPEFYWDPNGRITGTEQFIKAVTATLEYKWRLSIHTILARLEYRYDELTGSGGGFFSNGQVSPGIIGLTPEQHLLLCSLIWYFDR